VIRLAHTEDIPRIVELGSRSLAEGPYRDMQKDVPEQSAKFAAYVMANGKVLVYEDEGKIVGLLAMLMLPHYLSMELTATEVMWYVTPENRPGGAGMRLLWEAEKMAKDAGAVSMVFAAPSGAIGAIYERFGYKPIETNYRKVL
jgi:N-acetylglutamate synthase-like GNAT family acetyltransferase